MLRFLSMYERIISLKVDFWSCFTKGRVLVQVFEDKINEQLSAMKEFYLLNDISLGSYKYNHQLVSLLMGYEKFILLKDKVSAKIVERANALRVRNTKSSSFRRERNEKLSVEKWIYSQSSCTFEAAVNMEQMGIVVAASKSVEAVFGYKADVIRGCNINKIMPHSMQEEHDYILEQWANNSSWANVGVLRDIFCITRENVSFSSGIYLKLVQRADSINILGSIFK